MANPERTEIASQSNIFRYPEVESQSVISSKTHALISRSYIEPKRETIMCDGSIYDDIIEEFGSTIFIGVMSQDTDDMESYQSDRKTYTWHKTTALVLQYGEDDDRYRDSDIANGGITFSLANSDEYLANINNVIKYLGETYEIQKIVKHPSMDSLYCIELIAT